MFVGLSVRKGIVGFQITLRKSPAGGCQSRLVLEWRDSVFEGGHTELTMLSCKNGSTDDINILKVAPVPVARAGLEPGKKRTAPLRRREPMA